jgi:curli biogenesis system outer membrane secretion channel CsgG/outer membrane protein OmpA-like peptidoglycan-associated protein
LSAAIALALLGLPGCARIAFQKAGEGEAPVVMGPQVRSNRTPMEPAFACLADRIAADHKPRITIGVGDVKDYTGKYDINEGNAITQGGALMVYSALGKLGQTVQIAERFDTHIGEMELGYIDRRQLGDGFIHALDAKGAKVVPWLPYFGGSIMKSDYYIVGGITELNYDIQSGGAQFQINELGPKERVYTESVAVDLRVVNSRNLTVVRTISFEKQLTGYEVGFNIFRFFGSSLYDVNIGSKGQEAAQLGVRTALEEAVLQLVGTIEGEPVDSCIDGLAYAIPQQTAAQLRSHPDADPAASPTAAPPTAAPAAVAPAPVPVAVGPVGPAPTAVGPAVDGQMVGDVQNGGDADAGQRGFKVAFDFGSAELPGSSLSNMDRIAALSKQGPVQITLLARDTETWDPGKRDQLIGDRMAAVARALGQRGVPPGAIALDWKPAPTDSGIVRDGAGFQEIARLHVQQ